MSQQTPIIGPNKSGLAYRQEDNDGKRALMNHHKGAEAPAYAEAGMLWLDDSETPWRLKLHDGTDWIVISDIHAGDDAATPYLGGANTLFHYRADTLASAATTDLGSADGNLVQVTGTETVTSLGSSAGTDRPVFLARFGDAATLTHNATSLALPGSADIVTATGDAAVFQYLGSGNWRCLQYSRADGHALAETDTWKTAADSPAGDDADGYTAPGKYTIAATPFANGPAGAADAGILLVLARSFGALAQIYVPQSAAASTAYLRTSTGSPPSLSWAPWTPLHDMRLFRQSILSTYTANADLTTALPIDDSIPQSTEGTEIISQSITPSSTSSKIRIRFSGHASGTAGAYTGVALFCSQSSFTIAASGFATTGTSSPTPAVLEYEHSPATTSAVTYSIRVGTHGGSAVRFNGTTSARRFGGRSVCTFVVEEILT